MNLDELQTQITDATKRLSQRFSQAETERPPKKPPEITSVLTSLEPGPLIRDVATSGNTGAAGGQSQPPPPDEPPGSDIACEFSETVTGAVNGVPATLEVCVPDETGWVTI